MANKQAITFAVMLFLYPLTPFTPAKPKNYDRFFAYRYH